jgi:hypothetical protein
MFVVQYCVRLKMARVSTLTVRSIFFYYVWLPSVVNLRYNYESMSDGWVLRDAMRLMCPDISRQVLLALSRLR